MNITIISAEITEERGLGPLYRISQLRDSTPWIHLIARSALAADMELFGAQDPAVVLDWHLHEALAPLTTEPSAADRLAFQAQQLTAAVLTYRAGLATRTTEARLVGDLADAQDQADAMRDQARDMKTAEIDQLKETVTVAEDQGLANLRTLVAGDENSIDVDRATYRDQITNSVTA